MSLAPCPAAPVADPRPARLFATLSSLTLLVSVGAWSARYLPDRGGPRADGGGSSVEPGTAPAARPVPLRLIRSVRTFSSLQVVEPREKRFDEHITAAAKEHRIDPALLRAVIQVESNFAPNARSRKGARGLMQLMPATAQEVGVKSPHLDDPRENIRAGAAYLSVLAKRFGETNADWIIAAYNAGPGAVERWGGVPPYPKTREYVRQVVARWGTPVRAARRAGAVVSG